ncbi:MAG TPA: TadE/TadG family type IV pilus assembly protein [Roseovarius sp.]
MVTKSESTTPLSASRGITVTHSSIQTRRKTVLHAAGQRLRRKGIAKPSTFHKDEDGAIVVFTLFALLMMLIAGGIAIDVMRQEMTRARIQNTLDTAVLAGAGAPYGTSPKLIVQDFMAKADMGDYLAALDDDGLNDDDDIIQTMNSSKVSASASTSMDTLLMHLSGVKQLGAAAASSAERRVPKLEVAMVLDVSGSMDRNSKLTNLKSAGKKFITSILESSEHGDAVISVVPFSWDVSPGWDIIDALDVDARHDYSTCLQFEADDYKSTAIDPDDSQTQLIYTSEYDYGFDKLNSVYRTCYNEPNAEILPYSISKTALHNKIDALEANGNTSGNQGMKWGAALLDPKFASVKTALGNVVTGQNPVMDAEGKPILDSDGIAITEPIYMVDPLVGAVPAKYDEGETLKVIVMMGDGQNTYSNQFPLVSGFRGPDSFLHYVEWEEEQFKYAYREYNAGKTSDSPSKCGKKGWVCVYEDVSKSSYYLYNPYQDEYRSLNDGPTLSSWQFENLETIFDGFKSSTQFSWEMAWGRMSPNYLSKIFGYKSAENQFESSSNRVQGSEKDTRMQSVCTAAKKKNVVVYTIGFEIGEGSTAEVQLKKCATSDAHYYRAEGINITDAFSSIASNVINLRLTQ